MGRLDHRHHAFIQSLMARGPITDTDAKSMFVSLCQQGSEEFPQFVAIINKEMNFLQLEIRAGTNQYDGKLYYGIVNKVGNEQAKLGTRYTHAQIAFFKAVLERVIFDTSLEGKISSIQALNLQLEAQNEQESMGDNAAQAPVLSLTLAQKEKTLQDLTHDHWLNCSADGMVALGVRTFLELWNVFKNYDVPICDVCNEAGIKAQACRNEECSVRMHDYCVKKKFHRARVPKECPKCRTEWNTNDNQVLGSEQEANGVFEDEVPSSSPGLRRLRKNRKVRDDAIH